jgi:cytochrome c556
MKALLASFALLLTGGLQGAQADAPEELIIARKASMETQSAKLAAITQAIVINADVKQFATTGEEIAEWSQGIVAMFPDGTEGQGSDARPAVWSDRPGFEKAAANLGDAAQRMAKAATGGDQSAFLRAYRGTMLACAACHFTYRTGRN